MNHTTIIAPMMLLFILFFVVIPQQNKRKIMYKLIKDKKKGDRKTMKALAEKLIDKHCLVYLFNGSQTQGVIKEVSDGAVLVEYKGEFETVNLDFVMRIREVPKNKKGEYKKTFI